MIPLPGQTLNTGHLMQPTANATGQSVMISLPSKCAAGLHAAVRRMVLPGTPGGATFHDTAGPLAWYPAARAVYVERNDKTRQRDLRGLQDAGMLWIDSNEWLVPGFVKPNPEFNGSAAERPS